MSADSMKVWLPSLGESTSLLSKLRLKTGEVNIGLGGNLWQN